MSLMGASSERSGPGVKTVGWFGGSRSWSRWRRAPVCPPGGSTELGERASRCLRPGTVHPLSGQTGKPRPRERTGTCRGHRESQSQGRHLTCAPGRQSGAFPARLKGAGRGCSIPSQPAKRCTCPWTLTSAEPRPAGPRCSVRGPTLPAALLSSARVFVVWETPSHSL